MSTDPRYVLVAASFLTQGLTIGIMFAYGVFFPFLEAEFGWSRELLSSSISVAVVVMGLLALPGGSLIDRYGPRWVMTVTGLICGVGYVLTAWLEAPWQLFAFFGLCVGIGLSTHDVGTLSVVARIFHRRRGMMTGIVKVGTAAGQMTIPLLASALIGVLGWRDAALWLGIGAAVLLVIAAQGMRPERVSVPAGSPASPGAAEPAPPRTGPTLGEAAKTRPFWTLCIAQLCFLPALVTLPVHLPVLGVDLGMTATGAAGLLTMVGGASVAGRLVVGRGIDWLGGRRAMLLCFTILGVSLAVMPALATPLLLYLVTGVYGFAHGGLFTVVSPTVAEYFGMRAHGAIFGSVILAGTLGAAVGPIAAGRVFDMTGSYALAFNGLAVLVAFGLLMVLSLPPAPAARDARTPTAGPQAA